MNALLENLGKLWVESWKGFSNGTTATATAAHKAAGAGRVAAGSRLFSVINSALSSGLTGITMLTMVLSTTLTAISITYDTVLDPESPLQIQDVQLDTGVVADMEGNPLPSAVLNEEGVDVSGQPGTGAPVLLNLMDLIQSFVEPEPDIRLQAEQPPQLTPVRTRLP